MHQMHGTTRTARIIRQLSFRDLCTAKDIPVVRQICRKL